MQRLAGFLASLLVLCAPALAQPAPAPSPPAAAAGARPTEGAGLPGRRLPPDVATEHVLDLPGRQLRFTAVAGSLPLVDSGGTVQAEIGYVSYTRPGFEPGSRPVTFAVNGGPGASSAYLHLLVAGPWRLPLDGRTISPSAPISLGPNAETWLDFTDLVFIDPVDTGYSRAAGSADEQRDRYFTIEGDVTTLASVISRWLRANDRLASPKFFMGESYGGFRGPLVVEKLQTELGIGFSGAVLVSPVLDFGWLGQGRHEPLEFAARLPSLAAGKRERAGPITREALADAERYAAGEYLTDLMRGVRDREAVDRVSARVAELSGLDPDLVRRRGGRLDAATVQRELDKATGQVASAYDTGVVTFDVDPTSPRTEGPDAVLTAMTSPLSSAIVDHLWRRLGWRVPNQRYELLNGSVNGRWRYGRGRRPPQAVDELKGIVALDPAFRLLVVHGLTDLVTPYFASELILRQVPAYGDGERVALRVYPGGHMFYSRDASRAAFRADGEAMVRRALEARGRE